MAKDMTLVPCVKMGVEAGHGCRALNSGSYSRSWISKRVLGWRCVVLSLVDFRCMVLG